MIVRYLITGITGGVGFAFLEKLVEVESELHLILLVQNIDKDILTNFSKKENITIDLIQCNLNKEKDIFMTIEKVKNKYDYLDVIVNIAGIGYHSPIDEIVYSQMLKTFNINSLSPIYLISSMIPLLDQSANPTIINIGSILSTKGMNYTAIYTASKHALDGYIKVLRIEKKEFKIVNIEPGAIETKFIKNTNNHKAISLFSERNIKKINPSKIADMIILAINSEFEFETIRISPIEQNI